MWEKIDTTCHNRKKKKIEVNIRIKLSNEKVFHRRSIGNKNWKNKDTDE